MKLREIVKRRRVARETPFYYKIIAISYLYCRCHGLIREGFCVYAFVVVFSRGKSSPFVEDEMHGLESMVFCLGYLGIIN